jgi:hypothetical protein
MAMRCTSSLWLAVPLLAVLAPAFGCQKKRVEGYRVVGYDSSTNHWTLLRNGTFDGKYLTKRLTLICDFYKWGKHPAVAGPDACHLEVGRMIVPNTMPPEGRRSEFLDVYEMPTETLAITEGDGSDKVEQQFTILKYEVLPDNPNG